MSEDVGERKDADRSTAVDAGGLFGPSVDCNEAVHELYHYLDGELTEERREEIRVHLDWCGPCSGAAEFEAELRKVIANRCKDRVPETPHPARGRSHRRRKPAARRRALTSLRPPRTSRRAVRPWWTGLWRSVWPPAPSFLKPAPASYRSRDLQGQFDELTARAESLVSEATGLHSAHGSARAKVTDRPGWASANVRSIERLVGPALTELQRKRAGKLAGPSLVVGRAVAGTQLGLMLAYMATRVLGQYDLLINDESPEDQDLVSYVGPNIVGVEEQYGFAPSQFRLWLALHEVTHRLQFTAVPWLRDHFVGLVTELLGPLSGDPAGFAEMVRRATAEVRAGRNPAREAGVVGMLATPEQRLALSKISGMMSLLEGHGDVTMDRAGAAEVPGAAHFSQVLHERRTQARGLTKLMSKLLGLDAKMRQYAEGERFVESVEAAGGPSLLARVWEGPEWLPTLEEIRDPAAWVARAGG